MAGETVKVASGTSIELPTRHPTRTVGPSSCSGPITNVASSRCMDVRGGSSDNGTPVQINTCNGTAAQQRTYDPSTGALKALGKCLASTDGGMVNGTNSSSGTARAAPAGNGRSSPDNEGTGLCGASS